MNLVTFAPPPSGVSETDIVTFVRARARLLRIARRVVVNPVDADDIVQDACVRWLQTDRSVVRDPAAFLTTATTRLALNLGQSARARHESAVGTWTAEAADPAGDLLHGAERGEAVEAALWTLLACLSAPERAVYILREAFEYPHRRIAQLLGLSEANVRQIVTRARRRIALDARGPVDPGEHAHLVERFRAAAQTGELAELEALLSGQGAGELAA
jgi:RNA polymerase sigma-70 factor (ECF subfamily)